MPLRPLHLLLVVTHLTLPHCFLLVLRQLAMILERVYCVVPLIPLRDCVTKTSGLDRR